MPYITFEGREIGQRFLCERPFFLLHQPINPTIYLVPAFTNIFFPNFVDLANVELLLVKTEQNSMLVKSTQGDM